jgi:hypothetical protein
VFKHQRTTSRGSLMAACNPAVGAMGAAAGSAGIVLALRPDAMTTATTQSIDGPVDLTTFDAPLDPSPMGQPWWVDLNSIPGVTTTPIPAVTASRVTSVSRFCRSSPR